MSDGYLDNPFFVVTVACILIFTLMAGITWLCTS